MCICRPTTCCVHFFRLPASSLPRPRTARPAVHNFTTTAQKPRSLLGGTRLDRTSNLSGLWRSPPSPGRWQLPHRTSSGSVSCRAQRMRRVQQ